MLLADISPLYAFEQSDLMGRLIVLVLLGASVLAWSILVEKWLYLRQLGLQVRRHVELLGPEPATLETYTRLQEVKGPLRGVAESCLRCLADIWATTPEKLVDEFRAGKYPRPLTSGEIERVAARLDQAVDDEVERLEVRLGLLSTVVSASPFLGLLGTVWGVMITFIAMAIKGRIDIQAIAPGVSGALLTTVVGLLVAIPALIGYNILTNTVRLLTLRLEGYSAGLLAQVKVLFTDAGGPRR